MNFDQLGQSWRDENKAAVSEAPAEEKRLEQYVATTRATERFAAKVFRRDLIETAAGLFVIYAFGSMLWEGKVIARATLPMVSAAGMVINILGAIYVIYRLHRTRTSTPTPRLDASMREYCDSEIERVEKQMAMLRSVHIWYLGPFYVGVLLVFLGVDGPGVEFVIMSAVVTVLYAFIAALNRFAASTVMTDLRDQLAWLRDSLGSATAPVGELPETADHSKAAKRFAFRWFFACLGVGLGGILFGWLMDVEYPKRSPFDAVRWQGEAPEVRLEEEWFRLVSIDGVAVDEILASGKQNYHDRWRMRFEEDLVELLARMGNKPGDMVRLVVLPLGSDDEIVLEAVPMTEEKRQSIKRSPQRREVAYRWFAESFPESSDVMRRHVGKYQFPSGHVLNIAESDGQLTAQLTGQEPLVLLPRSESEWDVQLVDATLTFKVDGAGKSAAVELFQNGGRQIAKRFE